MTSITWAATDLITGQLLADQIPLDAENFSVQLNGGGTLTGVLDLQAASGSNAPFAAAVECRRAVVWALADGFPVWNGILWDWPDETRADGTLPVAGQTLDSLWARRLITSDLGYDQVDLFTVFLDLLTYGTTKLSPYILATSALQGPVSPLVAAAAAIARLVLPGGPAAVAGVPWTTSYAASDLTQVAQAWSDLVTSGNVEFTFQPGIDSSGNLTTYLRLAYTQLGRPAPESGYALTYPGNALDYGYTRTGSQSANVIWATAPPNGSAAQWQSAYPHGYDLADLAAGYPLLESAASWSDSVVTEQSQIDSYADGQVALQSQAMTTPVIKIGGGGLPGLSDIVLGDTVPFAATSELHPAQPGGRPGLQQLIRVSGWTCYPSGPETSEYTLISTSGVAAP